MSTIVTPPFYTVLSFSLAPPSDYGRVRTACHCASVDHLDDALSVLDERRSSSFHPKR